jgi:dUTP pyrophosphatase
VGNEGCCKEAGSHTVALQWKKLNRDAIVPQRKTMDSAGFDLHVIEDRDVEPGETVRVRTGLSVAIPVGYAGFIKPRSSAFFDGWDMDGTIDADYRGEVLLQVRNTTTITKHLKAGDRPGQMCIVPVWVGLSLQVDHLDETARGAGGFGSTGLR